MERGANAMEGSGAAALRVGAKAVEGRHAKALRRGGRRAGMLQAVLWDLDGTLLDSVLSIRDTMNRVLAERGLSPFSKTELDGLIGNPLRHILARKTSDASSVEAMALRYRVVYNDTGWVTATVFPGLLDVVAALRAKGIPQGVVTSKGQSEAETLLFDLGVSDLFDAVVGDDDRRPLKPNPDPVLAGCALLGAEPARTAMVGDTEFDIRAAKSAGAIAVGVLWGIGTPAGLRKAAADHLAATPQDLLRLLSSLHKV